MRQNFLMIAVAVAAPFSGWGASAKAADSIKKILEFRDPKTNELLIVGQEETSERTATTVKRTEYRVQGSDAVIAREATEYDTETLELQGYSFEDYQSGEKSLLQSEAGQRKVEYRASGGAKTETSQLTSDRRVLGNASVRLLIERNWEKLKRGDAVPFEFYVPFKLTSYAFQIIQKDSKSGLQISVEPSNWLIRQFVKKAVFELDTASQPPKVARFIGPSHIEIKGQANREVVIIEK